MSFLASLGEFGSQYKKASDEFDAIGEKKLAAQRQLVSDEQARMKRFREEENRRAAQKNAKLEFAPGSIEYHGQPEPQAPTSSPTGGGTGYVPRPQGKVTDKSIEISEASKRLSAMRNRPGVGATPGLSAMDKLLAQRGTLPANEVADIKRLDARSAQVPAAAISATEARLKSLQSEESARQRGRAPVEAQDFISRIRQAESGGRMNAVGPNIPGQGTAKSDMQVMDATNMNPGFGVRPAQSNTLEERSRVGREYAQALLARYGNEVEAAAAYNWGPGNYDRWKAAGADPSRMPAETRNYVAKVTRGGQQQAAAPMAQPTQQVPAQPQAQQTFGPNAPAGQNAILANQMEYLQSRLQNAQTSQEAETVRTQMQSLQIGDLVQRAASDESALGSLANAAGVSVKRTPQGYVIVANDPVTGRQVPVGAPVPAGAIAQQIQLRIDPVARQNYQKYRQELDLKMFEVQKAISVAQTTGDYKLAEEAMRNATTLRQEMLRADQLKVQVDQMGGGAFVTQGDQLSYVKTGDQGTKFGGSNPTRVPIQ